MLWPLASTDMRPAYCAIALLLDVVPCGHPRHPPPPAPRWVCRVTISSNGPPPQDPTAKWPRTFHAEASSPENKDGACHAAVLAACSSAGYAGDCVKDNLFSEASEEATHE